MPKMTSETWLWPGPLPVEKVTIAPMGERRQTFYLEISNETADWVTGKQLKKDGQWAENKQGQNIIQIIDPSGTIEAWDDPAALMARIIDMYAETPPEGQPPITLDDVAGYIRGMRVIEEDRVCPECYANVRCDCA